MRSNFKLAYAGGFFLLTFDDGSNGTSGLRFDSAVDPLDASPFPLVGGSLAGLDGHADGFYAVWSTQRPDFTQALFGSRLDTAGRLLDGAGVDISRTNPPYASAAAGVAWDGATWSVTWGDVTTTRLARVDAAGRLLNPGGFPVPGLMTGASAGTGDGGVALVWSSDQADEYEIYGGHVGAGGDASDPRVLSLAAAAQIYGDLGAGGTGFLVVYRSDTGTARRILAQPLNGAGNPLTPAPTELVAGAILDGPGTPAVAWNGASFLVTWSDGQSVFAQRLAADGSRLDPAPVAVLATAFGPVAVAALDQTFLVVGLRCGVSCQYVFPVAVRIAGDGTILDPAPIALGYIYASTPRVVALDGRWLVAWRDNASHDDPLASTLGAFIAPDGASRRPRRCTGLTPPPEATASLPWGSLPVARWPCSRSLRS